MANKFKSADIVKLILSKDLFEFNEVGTTYFAYASENYSATSYATLNSAANAKTQVKTQPK